ncbi:MAG: hypothetical protein R2812_10470 [Gelidibacter sp.]
MKNIKKGCFILLLISIFGCQNQEKNNSKSKNQEKELLKKEFVVTINFKSNKSDTFDLYLYNIIKDEYQSKYIVISEKTIPTSEMENITANFGENISRNFRINFGNNEVKDIQIKSIEISFGPNKIFIDPEDLTQYFNFNEYIFQDSDTYVLHTQQIDGKHNPIIYLKSEYLGELQKE